MGIEIERKYLVNKALWQQVQKAQGTPITQGYLVAEPHKTIRVRVTDKTAFITIKGKSAGSSRSEYEYEIPQAEGQQLLDNFADTQISKTRYCITYKDKLWEVDEFLGDDDGLLMAEIELDTENEQFELPAWIDSEVTSDKRYYNSYLAQHHYNTWK
jgi:adenylate cyclase